MSSIRNWVGKAAVLLLPIALGACAQYAQYGMTTTAPSEAGPLAWEVPDGIRTCRRHSGRHGMRRPPLRNRGTANRPRPRMMMIGSHASS